MSYEQGFLDALILIKNYVKKSRDLKELEEILDEIYSCILEKKMERIKEMLLLIR